MQAAKTDSEGHPAQALRPGRSLCSLHAAAHTIAGEHSKGPQRESLQWVMVLSMLACCTCPCAALPGVEATAGCCSTSIVGVQKTGVVAVQSTTTGCRPATAPSKVPGSKLKEAEPSSQGSAMEGVVQTLSFGEEHRRKRSGTRCALPCAPDPGSHLHDPSRCCDWWDSRASRNDYCQPPC